MPVRESRGRIGNPVRIRDGTRHCDAIVRAAIASQETCRVMRDAAFEDLRPARGVAGTPSITPNRSEPIEDPLILHRRTRVFVCVRDASTTTP